MILVIENIFIWNYDCNGWRRLIRILLKAYLLLILRIITIYFNIFYYWCILQINFFFLFYWIRIRIKTTREIFKQILILITFFIKEVKMNITICDSFWIPFIVLYDKILEKYKNFAIKNKLKFNKIR